MTSHAFATTQDNHNAQVCYADSCTTNYNVVPFKEKGFKHFPSYLSDFVTTGIRHLGKDGSFGYFLEGLDNKFDYVCCTLNNHKDNTIGISQVKDQLSSTPKKDRFVQYAMFDDLYIEIWNNIKVKPNWIRAMKFLERFLLTEKVKNSDGKNINIFAVSTASIVELLKRSHKKLSSGLKASNRSNINTSVYRDSSLFMLPDAIIRDNMLWKSKKGHFSNMALNFLQVLEARGIDSYELSVIKKFDGERKRNIPIAPGKMLLILGKFVDK